MEVLQILGWSCLLVIISCDDDFGFLYMVLRHLVGKN